MIPTLASRIVALALAVFAGAMDAAPDRGATGNRMVQEAQRIVAAVKSSSYSHKTRINEAEGSYLCDCSGFVGWILKKVAPDALKAVSVSKGHSHALAEDFYTAFSAAADDAASTPWRRIPRAMDARPGDVLACARCPRPPAAAPGT